MLKFQALWLLVQEIFSVFPQIFLYGVGLWALTRCKVGPGSRGSFSIRRKYRFSFLRFLFLINDKNKWKRKRQKWPIDNGRSSLNSSIEQSGPLCSHAPSLQGGVKSLIRQRSPAEFTYLTTGSEYPKFQEWLIALRFNGKSLCWLMIFILTLILDNCSYRTYKMAVLFGSATYNWR